MAGHIHDREIERAAVRSIDMDKVAPDLAHRAICVAKPQILVGDRIGEHCLVYPLGVLQL